MRGAAHLFDALLGELALYKELLDLPNKRLGGFDIGGGTPAFVDAEHIARLVDAIGANNTAQNCRLAELYENTHNQSLAKALTDKAQSPAIVFVTAHDNYAVEAFDLEAVDYVLKPVKPERLERAVARAIARRGDGERTDSAWLEELWIPHRSELIRIATSEVGRIDAERDYVRLHVGEGDAARTYLLLQTIAGLEKRLDPDKFIRIHRSTILRKDRITGLRHDGLGVWSVEMGDDEALRIGRTYLPKVKAMAGR